MVVAMDSMHTGLIGDDSAFQGYFVIISPTLLLLAVYCVC